MSEIYSSLISLLLSLFLRLRQLLTSLSLIPVTRSHLLLHQQASTQPPAHTAINFASSPFITLETIAQWTSWLANEGSTTVSINHPNASLDALVPLLTDCLRTLNLHVASKHPLSHNIVQLRLQRSLNGGVPQGTAELVDEVDEESVDSGFAAGSLSNPDSDVSDDSDSETVLFTVRIVDKGREGKAKLVQVARELAERALAVQKEGRGEARVSDSVDVALVDRMLRGSCDIPEPELMYVVTDSTSHNALEMNGYPPWEIRLTEIYHIKGFRALEYQDYVDGLEMYAKCEKRVGK